MVNSALKAACIAVYALALASIAGWLPEGMFSNVRTIAAILLVLHALELVFVFRHVKAYRGPLAASVVLTLLFGVLHGRPLAAGRNRAESAD